MKGVRVRFEDPISGGDDTTLNGIMFDEQNHFLRAEANSMLKAPNAFDCRWIFLEPLADPFVSHYLFHIHIRKKGRPHK